MELQKEFFLKKKKSGDIGFAVFSFRFALALTTFQKLAILSLSMLQPKYKSGYF